MEQLEDKKARLAMMQQQSIAGHRWRTMHCARAGGGRWSSLDGQVRPPHAPEHALRQRLGHRRLLLLLGRRQSSDRGRRARQGRRREPAQQEPGGEVDADVRHPGRDQRGEAAAEVEQPVVRVHGGERRRHS